MNQPPSPESAEPSMLAAASAEMQLLKQLRAQRKLRRQNLAADPKAISDQLDAAPLTRGQYLADRVAATIGSWRFILIQSTAIIVWITGNVLSGSHAWDPYPFILLNLLLSFQAAYTAPAIMMSQNRQSELDRSHARNDYEINVKAELEIELLHDKIDLMKERELQVLTEAIQQLSTQLEQIRHQLPK
ncbi:DUF1003 domain-containing protein [Rhodoferax sp. GW822-FHT02A01]|uniref:DUF1003 domain-containing protein n=1 Tax=Rhodoferax sp. GW822-FHT02A01 TaxID=3141537 RepID=UPI00315DC338